MAQITIPIIIKILVPIIYSLMEYKLGKTNNGSMIGAIINLFSGSKKKDYGMNTELKAFIIMFFDLGKLTQMAIKDKGFSAEEEAPALKIFMEAPGTFSASSKALTELKALDAVGEADMVAFLGTQLGVVDAKSANIILKGVSFILAGYNLEQAITSK